MKYIWMYTCFNMIFYFIRTPRLYMALCIHSLFLHVYIMYMLVNMISADSRAHIYKVRTYTRYSTYNVWEAILNWDICINRNQSSVEVILHSPFPTPLLAHRKIFSSDLSSINLFRFKSAVAADRKRDL